MAIPTRREYCQKRVFSGERYDSAGHDCTRKPVKDGLCALHQPEAIEARQKKLEAKWAAERELRDKGYRLAEERRRRADCFDPLVAALKEALPILEQSSGNARAEVLIDPIIRQCRAALDLANPKE